MAFYCSQHQDSGTPARSTSVHVIIQPDAVDVFVPVPQFTSAFYRGALDASTRELVIPQPTITAVTYHTDIQLRFAGSDNALFAYTNEANQITVSLARPLTDADVSGKTILLTTLVAERADVEAGSAVIVVDVPLDTTTPPSESQVPTFEQGVYVGAVDAERQLGVLEVTIVQATFSTDVQVRLSGPDAALFRLQSTASLYAFRVVLAGELTALDVQYRSHFLFEVHATRTSTESSASAADIGKTAVLVNIASSGDGGASRPRLQFDRTFYAGEIDASEPTALVLEASPTLLASTYSSDVECTVDGENADLFTISADRNVLQLKLLRALTDAELALTMLRASIVASRDAGADRTTAEIVVTLPRSDAGDPATIAFAQTTYVGRLDLERALAGPTITLDAATWTADIRISVVDDAAELLEIPASTGNSYAVRLRRAVTDAEVLDKTYLKYTLQAVNDRAERTVAVLLIEIAQPEIEQPTTPSAPTFAQLMYTGRLDAQLQMSIDRPTLLIETYSADTTFELADVGDVGLFAIASTADNVVTIALRTPLTEADVRGKMFIGCILRASRPAIGVGLTAIVIEMPAQAVAPKTLQFVQSVYRGVLDADLKLTFEDVRVVPETFDDDVQLSLIDDDSQLFAVRKSSSEVLTVELAGDLQPTDVADRAYLTTVLQASRPDVDATSSAVLLVRIDLTTPRPAITQPLFTQPQFRGRIAADLSLQQIEDVTLIAATYSQAVQFGLVDDDSALFVFEANQNVVRLTLRRALVDADLAGKDFLSFRVEATHPETWTSRAVVLIELPPKTCPVDETPVFDNRRYAFALNTATTGPIGTIRAVVPSDVERPLRYGLKDVPTALEPSLVLNPTTGQLTLQTSVVADAYTVEVFVSDDSTSLQAFATIAMTVSDVLTCPPDPSQHVEHALLVKYLVENTVHAAIMPSFIDDCTYEIVRMIPDDVAYVRIDAASGQIASISLDREADIFEYMDVPQIQVDLRLVCPADEPTAAPARRPTRADKPVNFTQRAIDPLAIDGRWHVLTGDSLPHAPRLTQLTVIIADVNDNAPAFVVPLVDGIVYGYPERAVAEHIMPEHLLRVHAIDRDAGLNAIVRYSVDANDHFQIHGETGALTPTRQAFADGSDQITLVVRATDRDGGSDGLFSERLLNVRRLRAAEIAVVSVQHGGLDDVEQVIDKVYTELGVEMRVLHAARIPTEHSVVADSRQSSSSSSDAGQVNVLRMFVYVIRNQFEILDALAVRDVLRDFNVEIYAMSTATMAEHLASIGAGQDGNGDQVALVAVCAVLGVLLLASAAGTFALWWYKIRPYEYRQMEEADGVSVESNHRQPIVEVMQPTATVDERPVTSGWRTGAHLVLATKGML